MLYLITSWHHGLNQKQIKIMVEEDKITQIGWILIVRIKVKRSNHCTRLDDRVKFPGPSLYNEKFTSCR